MAPSASMLFLSYHQLHQTAEAPPPPPRREEAAAAGGFRLSLSSVFSLGAFERRREAAPPAVRAEGKTVRERDAGEDIKSAAAAEAANKELGEKFEEAVRLSCWSC